MNRTFNVFLAEDVLRELREQNQITIVKLYTDPVTGVSPRSRYGYKGDKWYIPEQGRYSDARQSVIVFPDDKARMLVGNVGKDVIAPCKYDDCIGERVMASKMPLWAARTWVQIVDVGYPKRVLELTPAEHKSMGFHIHEKGVVSIGLSQFMDAPDMETVFRWWWNTNMGGWRVIKKGGIPAELHCYPCHEEDYVGEYDSPLPRKIIANPYVISYTVKRL